MSRAKHNRKDDVLEILEEIAEETLALTGFFHNGPEPYYNYLKRKEEFLNEMEPYEYNSDIEKPINITKYRNHKKIQNGVVRSNCIDCLDRTNAAQSIIGKVAFAHQLFELGCLGEPYLTFDTDAAMILEEMYRDLGDTIALQYGGSHLVNTLQTYRKINNWTSHSRDLIVSLKRYYSNSFFDAERQNAITLFLENSDHVSKDDATQITLDVDDPFHCNDIAAEFSNRNGKDFDETKSNYDEDKDDHVDSATMNNNTLSKFDFWAGYYNSSEYTSFEDLFLSRMNSNSRYTSVSPNVNFGPFMSKGEQTLKKPNFYSRSGSKWLNVNNSKTEKTLEPELDTLKFAQKPKNKKIPEFPVQEPLDIPQVSEASIYEYKRFLDQFNEDFKFDELTEIEENDTDKLQIPQVDSESEELYIRKFMFYKIEATRENIRKRIKYIDQVEKENEVIKDINLSNLINRTSQEIPCDSLIFSSGFSKSKEIFKEPTKISSIWKSKIKIEPYSDGILIKTSNYNLNPTKLCLTMEIEHNSLYSFGESWKGLVEIVSILPSTSFKEKYSSPINRVSAGSVLKFVIDIPKVIPFKVFFNLEFNPDPLKIKKVKVEIPDSANKGASHCIRVLYVSFLDILLSFIEYFILKEHITNPISKIFSFPEFDECCLMILKIDLKPIDVNSINIPSKLKEKSGDSSDIDNKISQESIQEFIIDVLFSGQHKSFSDRMVFTSSNYGVNVSFFMFSETPIVLSIINLQGTEKIVKVTTKNKLEWVVLLSHIYQKANLYRALGNQHIEHEEELYRIQSSLLGVLKTSLKSNTDKELEIQKSKEFLSLLSAVDLIQQTFVQLYLELPYVK
ncbi:hypothetical protein BB558_004611 [Smittium angustum]|nr:hypothetical protein BB558_004611 [Smittium angustum]